MLLEILVAISLLCVGLVGIIKSPMLFHKNALEHLEIAEADRIAAWTFTEIREQLKWHLIPEHPKLGEPISLPPVECALPSCKSLVRKYTLKTISEKTESSGRIYRMVSVRIQVGRRNFTYRLIVEKGC